MRRSVPSRSRTLPRRAARLQSARCRSARCAATTFCALPRQRSIAGCWRARANENVSGPRHLLRRSGHASRSGAGTTRPAFEPGRPTGRQSRAPRRERLAADRPPLRRPPDRRLPAPGKLDPGSTMLGFRIIPSSTTRCVYSWSKTRCRTSSVDLHRNAQGVVAVHEHFRLDDGHEAGLLAQRGVTRQRMRVRARCSPGWVWRRRSR